jgi:hypothetical protein
VREENNYTTSGHNSKNTSSGAGESTANIQSPTGSALRLAELGYYVFPCNYIQADGTCSCNGKSKGCDPGKHPHGLLVSHGYKGATLNKSVITNWWKDYPAANPAIACGQSESVIIDVDNKPEKGKPGLTTWKNQWAHLISEDTVKQETPSGGFQLFFRAPPGVIIKSNVSLLGPGIDVRGIDGYAVVAPSVTDKGFYRWTAGHAPWEIEPAPLPEVLVRRLAEPETKPKPKHRPLTAPIQQYVASHALAALWRGT